MPCVFVPEDDLPPQPSVTESARGHVRIEYKQVGDGPIILVMIPGLCCPSSMFDRVAEALAPDARYTSILIENRGMMGSGHASTGWRVGRLASDAWAVVDAVRKRREDEREADARIGLIGHSMGGMIVQRMAAQRPSDVALLVPISTHAGGLWNLVPTLALIRAFARYAIAGLNRPRAKATFNMGLHFTERFLRKHRMELMRRYLDGTTDDYTSRPGDPDSAGDVALRGHWSVVRSHSLSRADAAMLARCNKIYKLCIAGKSDFVIVPSATRKLARAIEANVVLEVEAAHFVVEEASSVVLAGLRIALNEAFGTPASPQSTNNSKSNAPAETSTSREPPTQQRDIDSPSIRQDCECSVCVPGNASIFENLRMC